MRRRSYLAAVGSVGAFAGCLGGGDRPSPDGGPASATPEPTPAFLECATPVTPTTPESGDVRRSDYPVLPADLTRTSANHFAVAFEQARQVNRLASNYGDRVTYVDFKNPRSEVRAVEHGYVVEYTDEFGFGYSSDEQLTVHGDDPFTVTYFVNTRIARRSEGTDDPREATTSSVVRCRP